MNSQNGGRREGKVINSVGRSVPETIPKKQKENTKTLAWCIVNEHSQLQMELPRSTLFRGEILWCSMKNDLKLLAARATTSGIKVRLAT
jgi:hypothetical protein